MQGIILRQSACCIQHHFLRTGSNTAAPLKNIQPHSSQECGCRVNPKVRHRLWL